MMIRQNPDKEKAKKIRDALRENNGYCPCSPFKTEDTKCMCKDFREMEEGTCHCELYIKTKD
jgi:ferredoxin-thioredoxin reductase catalytic subunit